MRVLITGAAGKSSASTWCAADRLRQPCRRAAPVLLPRTVQRTVDLLPRPESYYSISKVFGESLGYMYSSQCDIGVVAVRIGNWGGMVLLPNTLITSAGAMR